jgi:PilZ domain-containing protein
MPVSEKAAPFNHILLGFKDRRNFPRRRPRGTASLVPADKPMAPSISVTLVNISQGGVSFLAAKPLVVGQRIQIDLLAPGYSRPISVQAEVRWVGSSAKAGKYHVGCAWAQRVMYADLIRFF